MKCFWTSRSLKLVVLFVAALSFCFAFDGTAAAQTITTGALTGVVTDPSNAVVPRAQVTLLSNKGASQQVLTNATGVYRFFLLQPGTYTVTVKASGFQVIKKTVSVVLGQPTPVNFQLALLSAGTTVTVTEAAPLLQTDNGNAASTFSQQQVSQIPNPGNDLSDVAQLAPGVVMNTQSGYGNFSSYGMPGTSNYFTLNGMSDNDPFLNLNNSGATNLLLGQNEVAEAVVVQNGYSGEYGTLAGANINYVTKSGSNEFHGNAVYQWNGRAMNANSWLNNARGNPRPFDNVNQWAASLGGPIKRNKLFFFFNTEGLRVILPTSSIATIPSPQFEGSTIENLNATGLLASIPFYCQGLTLTAADGTSEPCPTGTFATNPSSVSAGQGIFNVFNSAPGASRATPTPGGGCSDFTNSLFEGGGGTIPCTLNFLSNAPNFTHEYNLSGRVDYTIGPNDSFFVRYEYDTGTQATYTDPINPIFNAVSIQPEHQGQMEETHAFGTSAVNQLVIAGQWYTAIFTDQQLAASLNVFPGTLSMGDGSLSLLGGVTAFAWPQGRNVTQAQVNDDVSRTWGNQTIKFGGTFRRLDVSDHDAGIGTIPAIIPFSLKDFYNGGSSGSIALQSFPGNTDLPIAYYTSGLYVEDDWHVSNRLSFTFALRAEHDSNPICGRNCFARLPNTFGALANGTNQATLAATPYNQSILSNQHTAFNQFQKILWEPRASFAWSPFGTSRNFVVRGGAGLFYDVFPAFVADHFSQNPPLDATFTPLFNNLASTQTNSNLYADAVNSNTAFQTQYSAGCALSPSSSSTPTCTFGTLGFYNPAQRMFAPQYDKWNLEIEKQFGGNTMVDVNYVGNHGSHIPIDFNSVNAYGFGSLPATAADPRFNEVQQLQNAGISNYNGVTFSFDHRFVKFGQGVFQANYTYSHGLDDVSNGGLLPFQAGEAVNPQAPQNPFDLRNMYGNSDYDIRHYFNANYVWNVPVRRALFGHGPSRLVEGWQVSGTIFARSGLPFTVIDGASSSLLNGQNYYASIFPNPLTPNVRGSNCGSEGSAGPHAVPCLTASIPVPGTCTILIPGNFGVPGCATAFGANGLRNAFRGPHYFDTDFSVLKRTKLPGWESGRLALGVQFFNLFNHPNFDLPINNTASGLFGTIQKQVYSPTSILGSFLGGDASPRLIQLKAELIF